MTNARIQQLWITRKLQWKNTLNGLVKLKLFQEQRQKMQMIYLLLTLLVQLNLVLLLRKIQNFLTLLQEDTIWQLLLLTVLLYLVLVTLVLQQVCLLWRVSVYFSRNLVMLWHLFQRVLVVSTLKILVLHVVSKLNRS